MIRFPKKFLLLTLLLCSSGAGARIHATVKVNLSAAQASELNGEYAYISYGGYSSFAQLGSELVMGESSEWASSVYGFRPQATVSASSSSDAVEASAEIRQASSGSAVVLGASTLVSFSGSPYIPSLYQYSVPYTYTLRRDRLDEDVQISVAADTYGSIWGSRTWKNDIRFGVGQLEASGSGYLSFMTEGDGGAYLWLTLGSVRAVPEPETYALLASGLILLARYGQRKRKNVHCRSRGV